MCKKTLVVYLFLMFAIISVIYIVMFLINLSPMKTLRNHLIWDVEDRLHLL